MLLEGNECASVALAQAIVNLRLKGVQCLGQLGDLLRQGQWIQDRGLVLGKEGRRELLDDLDIGLGILGQLGRQQTIHALLLGLLVSLVIGLGRRVLLLHAVQHDLLHFDAALAFHGVGNRVRLATDAHLGRRVADDDGGLDGVVASQEVDKGLVGGGGLCCEAGGVQHVAGSFDRRKHGRVGGIVDPLSKEFEFAEGLGDGDHPLILVR